MNPQSFPYQLIKANELAEINADIFVNKNGYKHPVLLWSGTATGKTRIVDEAILILITQHLQNQNVAVVWMSHREELALQSFKKSKEFFADYPQIRVIMMDDAIAQETIYPGDLIFGWWPALSANEPENRRRRRSEKNPSENKSVFEDMIDGKKRDAVEVIMIRDEDPLHKTSCSQEITDLLNPKIINAVTATPSEKFRNSLPYESIVKVKTKDAVDAYLRKQRICAQTEEQLKELLPNNTYTEETLPDAAIAQRQLVEDTFKARGKDIKPLLIIVLPNDDKNNITAGVQTKGEFILGHLRTKHPHLIVAECYYNKPMPIGIEDNNSKYDVLLFKAAASVGWDCPRVYVTLQYRETKTTSVQLQLNGRSLRMPEPGVSVGYEDDILRQSYLFTDYTPAQLSTILDDDLDVGHIPKTLIATLKPNVPLIKVPSGFLSRLYYGDIPEVIEFPKTVKKTFIAWYDIIDGDSNEVKKSKLVSKGLDLNTILMMSISTDAVTDIDATEFVGGKTMRVKASNIKIEEEFERVCRLVLAEQTNPRARYAPERSWSKVKAALRGTFMYMLPEYTHLELYSIIVNDIDKGALSVLRAPITDMLIAYDPIRKAYPAAKKKTVQATKIGEFCQPPKRFYPDNWKLVPQTNCMYDVLYLPESYPGRPGEFAFKDYIDAKPDIFWSKQDDKGRDNLGIWYVDSNGKERVTYVDWLTVSADGSRKGLFDTKAGNTLYESATKERAEAIQRELKEYRKLYPTETWVGGIVTFDSGLWHINDCDVYLYVKGQPINESTGWKKLEDVLSPKYSIK